MSTFIMASDEMLGSANLCLQVYTFIVASREMLKGDKFEILNAIAYAYLNMIIFMTLT